MESGEQNDLIPISVIIQNLPSGMTEDECAALMEEATGGWKVISVKKICDFCAKILSCSHPTQECKKCGKTYDRCFACEFDHLPSVKDLTECHRHGNALNFEENYQKGLDDQNVASIEMEYVHL